MAILNTYPALINSLEDARDFVRCGSTLLDLEPTADNIAHCKWVEDCEGLEIWHCYGADHYFIVEPSE